MTSSSTSLVKYFPGILSVVVSLIAISAARAQVITSVSASVEEAGAYYYTAQGQNVTGYDTNNDTTYSSPVSLPLDYSNAGATMSDTFSMSNLSGGGLEVDLGGTNTVSAPNASEGIETDQYGLAVSINFTLTASADFSLSMVYGSDADYPQTNGYMISTLHGAVTEFGPSDPALVYTIGNVESNESSPFTTDGVLLAPDTYTLDLSMGLGAEENATSGASDAGAFKFQLRPAIVPEPSSWTMALVGLGLLALRLRNRLARSAF